MSTADRAPALKSAAPPLALDGFLPYRLAMAASAVSGLIARRYEARFGITIPEWRLLAVLGEGAGLAQSALPSRTGMDKVAVSRAAARLIARNLVTQRPAPGDSRARMLALTADGRGVYAEIAPLALQTETELLAALDAPDRATAMNLLHRLEAAAAALAAR